MYITILGRQPALGVAELESLYGDNVQWYSDKAALISTDSFDFERLGGSQKAGKAVLELRGGSWFSISRRIVEHYTKQWKDANHKITLGLSVYGFDVLPRDIQKTGLIIKKTLRNNGVSVRLIPNAEPALNTATSHHNKLGLSLSHVELLIVRASNGRVIVAESIGAQNITALASRDQSRPRTDAFVGMLPPKLARMMINLSGVTAPTIVFDPFCGTGTVLQEALLLGYSVQGSDLSQKMVDYSQENINWLIERYRLSDYTRTIYQADATSYQWPEASTVGAIVCESYLGQPFSAPPSPAKLHEVRDNCNHIISSFLRNIHAQIAPGTPLVVAIPAWRDTQGNFTHLPLTTNLTRLGYTRKTFTHVRDEQLLYYRESQVVAREILVLRRE